MSLILEALRKSEAERRRGQAPDVAVELAPAPTPARVNLMRWLWPVLALMTLFAVAPVLAIWWATRTPAAPEPPSASASAPVDTPLESPREVVAPAVVPRSPPPAPTPAAPAGTDDIAPLPTPSPPTATLPTPPQPPPAPPPAAPTPQPTPVAVGMGGVRLSMHLWNDDPARRFVVLNGQRMTEGERNGDLLLVEILRDGVLVERAGQRARIDLP